MSDEWMLTKCSVSVARTWTDDHGRVYQDWLPVGDTYLDTRGPKDIQQTAVRTGRGKLRTIGRETCTDLPGKSDTPHLLVPAKITDMSARGYPGSEDLSYLYCARCACLVKKTDAFDLPQKRSGR